MSKEFEIITARSEDAEWREAMRSAGAFLASYRSPETRRGYQRDLHCWFAFCAGHGLHPYPRGIRRTHIELYLREAERHDPPPATATLYRRISTQLQGVPLREMQRAARHAKADTTVAYDQSEKSFHKDPTFVLMSATAR